MVFDADDPKTGFAAPVSTLHARRIVPLNPLVAVVQRMIGLAEVRASVVEPVAIHMVDKNPILRAKDHAMEKNLLAAATKAPSAIRGMGARLLMPVPSLYQMEVLLIDEGFHTGWQANEHASAFASDGILTGPLARGDAHPRSSSRRMAKKATGMAAKISMKR